MFWGSQAEDSNGEKQGSNVKNWDSNEARRESNDERRDSNGERRDSKGRLLPNPVLCCESLSVRATAQVHPTIIKNGNYI